MKVVALLAPPQHRMSLQALQAQGLQRLVSRFCLFPEGVDGRLFPRKGHQQSKKKGGEDRKPSSSSFQL